MRPEGNPLDLNNLPDDFTRSDGKQVIDDPFSTGHRKKKIGAKEGKDESGKVYECRFCSLKFSKSQALGGHMNRHRQERETETLNRARQLVFNNDNLAAPGTPHLGCCHPISPGSINGDPTLPLRFPTRMFSNGSSSSTLIPPPQPPLDPHQPYLYTSPSRPSSFQSHSINDYYVGHVLTHQNINYGSSSASVLDHSANYTCIGAPVGHGFSRLGGDMLMGSSSGGRDRSLQGHNQEQNHQGSNWGRSYAGMPQQRLDVPSSMINRFQDGL